MDLNLTQAAKDVSGQTEDGTRNGGTKRLQDSAKYVSVEDPDARAVLATHREFLKAIAQPGKNGTVPELILDYSAPGASQEFAPKDARAGKESPASKAETTQRGDKSQTSTPSLQSETDRRRETPLVSISVQINGVDATKLLAEAGAKALESTTEAVKTGKFEAIEAAGASALYAKFGHPLVERALIPTQLRADALVEAGAQPSLNPLSIARKAYLDGTSPAYEAATHLAHIDRVELASQKHLAQVKAATDSRAEALTRLHPSRMTAAELTEARTIGKQAEFFTQHSKFVDGTVPAERLNWTGLNHRMTAAKFGAAEIAPVSELAALKEGAKAETSVARLFETRPSLLKNFAVSAVAIGTESWLQSSAAETLSANGHSNMARLLQPTLPGAVAKTSALILGKNFQAKSLAFAGAHLYEAEINMSRTERAATAASALIPSVALKVFGRGKFDGVAASLAAADVGIWAAAELTDTMLRKNEKK